MRDAVAPRTAALFPGQGAQFPGMGRDAWERHPEAREVFARADRALGFAISEICFEGSEEDLRRTELQQPAILTTSLALHAVLRARGFRADVTAGLSLGEYSALVAAGALALEEAVPLVWRRGRYMQEAVPEGEGAMAAILGLSDDDVRAVCRDAGEGVTPANYNCPGQVVVSGTASAVERAVVLARERGARRAALLPVSAPFHCALMAPAARRLAGDLEAVTIRDPEIPVVTNVDGRAKTSGAELRRALLAQVESPVLWSECVREMRRMGAERFVEIGPGNALTGFMKRIDREAEARSCQDVEGLEALIASREGGLLK